MQACSKWSKSKADQPDIWERKCCEQGSILLFLSCKYRSTSDLHICDFLWSLNLWSMCYLLHCHFYSVSDLPELSSAETGLGHFRNHTWFENLVNVGRPKPSWASWSLPYTWCSSCWCWGKSRREVTLPLHMPQEKGGTEHLQFHGYFVSWNFLCFSSYSPKVLASVLQQKQRANDVIISDSCIDSHWHRQRQN